MDKLKRSNPFMVGRNQRRRISPLHSELEALIWAMECMLQLSTCQSSGSDCKDLVAMIKDPGAWSSFSTELKELMKFKERFTEFSLIFSPRSQNLSADSLAKTARYFHSELYFIGCCSGLVSQTTSNLINRTTVCRKK